jgi:hypothetical protein
MTRQVLYQNMLSDILDRFTNLQNGTEDYLDIYDVIVDGDIPLSINSLLAEPSLSACVSPWLNTMRDSYNGGTAGLEVTDAGYVIALFQTHSDQKYNRPFIFASTELTVFSARNLFIDAGDSYDPTLWIFSFSKNVKDREAPLVCEDGRRCLFGWFGARIRATLNRWLLLEGC